MCSPVSKQQLFEGENVVARVWNLDFEMQYDLEAIVDQCAAAFAQTDEAPAQPLVEGMVSGGRATCPARRSGRTRARAGCRARVDVAEL